VRLIRRHWRAPDARLELPVVESVYRSESAETVAASTARCRWPARAATPPVAPRKSEWRRTDLRPLPW